METVASNGLSFSKSIPSLSAYRLCLLLLVGDHVESQKDGPNDDSSSSETAFTRFLINSIRSREVRSLAELCHAIASVGAVRQVRALCEKLDSLVTVDDLHKVFARVRTMVLTEENSEPELDSRSVFGLFVRHSIMSFNSLMFDELSLLSDNVVSYRKAAEKSIPPSESSGGEDNVSEYDVALNARDYQLTLKHLHRQYDVECIGQRAHSLGISNVDNVDLRLSHRAVLVLAATYIHFGHATEAQSAVAEAAHAAQQASDDVCLARALDILSRTTPVNQASGQAEVERLLERAALRGLVLDRPGVTASAFLSAGRLPFSSQVGWKAVDSTPVDSQGLLNDDEVDERQERALGQHISAMIDVADQISMEHAGQADAVRNSTHAMRAASYAYHGNMHLAAVHAQGHVDLLVASERTANPAPPLSSDDGHPTLSMAEDICRSHCAVALQHHFQGNNVAALKTLLQAWETLSTTISDNGQGRPHESTRPPLLTSSALYVWRAAAASVLQHQALNRGDLGQATALVSGMSEIGFAVNGNDNSDQFQADILHRLALIHQARHMYDRAINIAPTGDRSPHQFVIRALAAVEFLLQGGPFGVSAALRLALSCAVACQPPSGKELAPTLAASSQASNPSDNPGNGLAGLHAHAQVILAEAMLANRSVGHAQQVVEHALPAVLALGDIGLVGRAYLAVGRCFIGRASEGPRTTAFTLLSSSLAPLIHAQAMFAKTESVRLELDTCYLLARVLDSLNRHRERNVVAERFRDLSVDLAHRHNGIAVDSSKDALTILDARTFPDHNLVELELRHAVAEETSRRGLAGAAKSTS